MKGRILITCVVLAIAAAACAGPDLIGGDDAIQETESVTDEANTRSGTTGEEPASEPGNGDQTTDSSGPDVDPPDENTPADEAPSTSASDLTPAAEQPVPVEPPEPIQEPVSGLQPIIDLAKADLAQRLSVGVETIAVSGAESVVWPDGGLGCPQPGMVYTQVQVDGTYIELIAGGVVYPYHSGGSQGPFLCQGKG